MHIRVSRVTNHRFPKLNCGYAGNHHRGNLAIKSPPLYHHSVNRMHTLLSVSGELGRKKTVCLLGDAATIWYPSLKGKCLMQTQGAWRMKGQKWQLSPVPLRRKKRGKMSRGGNQNAEMLSALSNITQPGSPGARIQNTCTISAGFWSLPTLLPL